MASVRKMALPSGWYPHSAANVAAALEGFSLNRSTAVRAVIAPHAGWFFSGRLAALAISALEPGTDTIVVAGGHLPVGAPVLFAQEDFVETPLGQMAVDQELRSAVCSTLNGKTDVQPDNTVEVLLPAVHWFFPNAQLLWLRLPAEKAAFDAGRSIAKQAALLGRRVAMVASTDLTHYGNNYGFTPKGSGKAALEWVKQTNDRRFIDAVLSRNADETLERAKNESSACSAGAVLCAMGFAGSFPDQPAAKLLDYTTSADVLRTAGEPGLSDSFVGYAAIQC